MNKKTLVLISLILSSFHAFAQGIDIKPKWKAGEKKTVRIETHITGKGRKEIDTTTIEMMNWTVKKETPASYVTTLSFENPTIETAAAFYAPIAKELPQYKTLNVDVEINKTSGKISVANGIAVTNFINQSVTKIIAILDKKALDDVFMAGIKMDAVKESFASTANVEEYMNDNYDFLFFAYGKHLTTGDTLRVTESADNPFQKGATLDQTTRIWIDHVSADKSSFEVHRSEVADMTAFKEMMRAMVEKMGKSFGAADSTHAKKLKEVDDINMEMSKNIVAAFNGSNWPEKIVETTLLTMNDGKRSNENKAVKTVTIK